MFNIWKKRDRSGFQFNLRTRMVPVVADAAVATGAVGFGKLIPLIIVDTTNRPDLVDLMTLHERVPPGDSDSTWVSIDGSKDPLALVLQFWKPLETELFANLELAKQRMSVDLHLTRHASYLSSRK